MINYKEVSISKIPVLDNTVINDCVFAIENKINPMPHRASDRLDDAIKVDFTARLDVPLSEAVNQLKDQKSCFFRVYLPPQSLLDWCSMNVPYINQKRVWLTHVGGGQVLIPHVDLTSDIKINLYLKDVTGFNQWHKPKKEYEHLVVNNKYEKDGQHLFSRLDIIDKIKLEKHKWYAFRSGIPHSVVDVEVDRMFIAMGCDDETFLS